MYCSVVAPTPVPLAPHKGAPTNATLRFLILSACTLSMLCHVALTLHVGAAPLPVPARSPQSRGLLPIVSALQFTKDTILSADVSCCAGLRPMEPEPAMWSSSAASTGQRRSTHAVAMERCCKRITAPLLSTNLRTSSLASPLLTLSNNTCAAPCAMVASKSVLDAPSSHNHATASHKTSPSNIARNAPTLPMLHLRSHDQLGLANVPLAVACPCMSTDPHGCHRTLDGHTIGHAGTNAPVCCSRCVCHCHVVAAKEEAPRGLFPQAKDFSLKVGYC